MWRGGRNDTKDNRVLIALYKYLNSFLKSLSILKCPKNCGNLNRSALFARKKMNFSWKSKSNFNWFIETPFLLYNYFTICKRYKYILHSNHFSNYSYIHYWPFKMQHNEGSIQTTWNLQYIYTHRDAIWKWLRFQRMRISWATTAPLTISIWREERLPFSKT